MSGPRTLVDVLADFESQGHTGQMRAVPGGSVECERCHRQFDAAALHATAYERLEGESDPADMVLVVAAECVECGEPGTLVLTYGPAASPDDAAVEAALELD